MPYIKEVCVAGKTIEVCKYYSVRWHSVGEKRGQRAKETSEAQKKVNQRQASKTLRRILNHNFTDGDLLVRLDFSKNKPKDSNEMQSLMSKAIRKLRKAYKRLGKELKYVYVKEIGSKGGRHVHMVINKCDTDTLRNCWEHGGIHIDPLISNGEYSKIADYFIKYAAKTEETEGELIGKRWYASRNIKKPIVKKRVISANKFNKKIKDKKGYTVLKDSVRSGFSDITGFEYFTYTLIKTDKEGGG